MKKNLRLLTILLICVAGVDILWLFFPDYIFRKYTIILTIPILILFYFLYVEVKNILYLLALVVFMLADYFFFIQGKLANGIASSGVALAIYGIIVLKQSHYISTRRLLVNTVPFLAIYTLPFIFFVDKIDDAIFGEVIFYSFAIGYFSFMSIMTYFSRKNKVTQKLILAGLSTAFMGIVFGMYLFVDRKPVYTVVSNLLFIYSHYKMWQYIIIKDSIDETVKI
ncbi:hypothetical protein U8527_16240 [Kordia algicida OT-1]|uniref:YhhN-like protein n=1 Tax=Kordia algicida OT-1 TaxID=391587 RepID=A9ECD6_9FLAO|nr:hypothetical protein [Kordia algicida]EDP94350.1 hypothetical protein KAOT1_09886 [Kordia algicida OT-1]